MRTFDSFDEYASDYREIHNQNIKISGADSDYFSMMKVAEVKKNEGNATLKILDLGCGDGKSAEFFCKQFESSEYSGIDVSKKSIEQASNKKIPNAVFQIYDGQQIPFGNETLDVIFVSCVFHHINYKFHPEILNEMKRVLKKGGRIYFFEHNPFNPFTRKIVKDCPFDKDAVLLSPYYSQKIFQNCGFEKVSLNFIIFMPRHRFLKFLFPLEKMLSRLPAGAQYYVKAIK